MYSGKETRKIRKLIQRHANKNNIQNAEHYTKYSETTSTNRQIQQKWHLRNEMLRQNNRIYIKL
jgi:hypothetical protein